MIYDPCSILYASVMAKAWRGIVDRSRKAGPRALLFLLEVMDGQCAPRCKSRVVHFIWRAIMEMIDERIARAQAMHGGDAVLQVKSLNEPDGISVAWCPWEGMMMRWQTSHHHDKAMYRVGLDSTGHGVILFESQGMFASEVSEATCRALEHSRNTRIVAPPSPETESHLWHVTKDRQCTYCGSDAGTQKCAACDGIARYCSTNCQLADWPKHKIACRSSRKPANSFDRCSTP